MKVTLDPSVRAARLIRSARKKAFRVHRLDEH
jgi:hypothetical protein